MKYESKKELQTFVIILNDELSMEVRMRSMRKRKHGVQKKLLVERCTYDMNFLCRKRGITRPLLWQINFRQFVIVICENLNS